MVTVIAVIVLYLVWWTDNIPTPPLRSQPLLDGDVDDLSLYEDGPDKPTPVFLFTYMRGGSTLLGELFNRNPDVMYWYEVADSYFVSKYGLGVWHHPYHLKHHPNGTARPSTPSEDQGIANFYHKLFTCATDLLPLETLSHPSLLGHFSRSTSAYQRCSNFHNPSAADLLHKCELNSTGSFQTCGEFLSQSLARGCPEKLSIVRDCIKLGGTKSYNFLTCGSKKVYIFPEFDWMLEKLRCVVEQQSVRTRCLPQLIETCSTSKLQVTKEHRISMASIGSLIKRIPGLRVIHYVRDPRGIVTSRVNSDLYTRELSRGRRFISSIDAEASSLCPQMLADILERKRLEEEHPEVFLTVKYEDLVLETEKTTRDVYRHVGLEPPVEVLEWLKKAMGGQHDSGVFGTTRANATNTAFSWRKELHGPEAGRVIMHCREVLSQLGYQIQVSPRL